MATIRQKPNFKKDLYEIQAWQENALIAGIDEVGRGCLAGPVVAAAIILHYNKKSRLLKDSKLLTQEELLKSYQWIIKNSWHAVAVTHNRTIDEVNIYRATLMTMRRAAMQLFAITPQMPKTIVVDAMPLIIPNFPGDIFHFIYGESKSSSIAAASIVAKVTRDGIMKNLEGSIPGYNIASHKGYSTPDHKKRLHSLDRSILHRISFIDHFLACDESSLQTDFTQAVLPQINEQTPL